MCTYVNEHDSFGLLLPCGMGVKSWISFGFCVLPECCIKLYNPWAVNEEAKNRKLFNGK